MFKNFPREVIIKSSEIPLDDKIRIEMNSWLSDEELSYAPKRIESFLAGRLCVRDALKNLDVDISRLAKDDRGMPLWPEGTCGSISHTKTMAIAAISNSLKSIGIDIEQEMSLSRFGRLKESFVSMRELELLGDIDPAKGTLIFSAKESLYKLINPLCHEYFGFFDAYVEEITSDRFSIVLDSKKEKVSKYNGKYEGYHTVFNENIVTILTI